MKFLHDLFGSKAIYDEEYFSIEIAKNWKIHAHPPAGFAAYRKGILGTANFTALSQNASFFSIENDIIDENKEIQPLEVILKEYMDKADVFHSEMSEILGEMEIVEYSTDKILLNGEQAAKSKVICKYHRKDAVNQEPTVKMIIVYLVLTGDTFHLIEFDDFDTKHYGEFEEMVNTIKFKPRVVKIPPNELAFKKAASFDCADYSLEIEEGWKMLWSPSVNSLNIVKSIDEAELSIVKRTKDEYVESTGDFGYSIDGKSAETLLGDLLKANQEPDEDDTTTVVMTPAHTIDLGGKEAAKIVYKNVAVDDNADDFAWNIEYLAIVDGNYYSVLCHDCDSTGASECEKMMSSFKFK